MANDAISNRPVQASISAGPSTAATQVLRPQAAPAPRSPEAPAKVDVSAAEVSKRDVERAVERIQEFAQNLQRNLAFSVDGGTGRTVITVTDRETREVIRQIPSEEFLEVAQTLQDISGKGSDVVGNLLDASA